MGSLTDFASSYDSREALECLVNNAIPAAKTKGDAAVVEEFQSRKGMFGFTSLAEDADTEEMRWAVLSRLQQFEHHPSWAGFNISAHDSDGFAQVECRLKQTSYFVRVWQDGNSFYVAEVDPVREKATIPAGEKPASGKTLLSVRCTRCLSLFHLGENVVVSNWNWEDMKNALLSGGSQMMGNMPSRHPDLFLISDSPLNKASIEMTRRSVKLASADENRTWGCPNCSEVQTYAASKLDSVAKSATSRGTSDAASEGKRDAGKSGCLIILVGLVTIAVSTGATVVALLN